ncbi:MAG: hypothetical protein ACRD2G_07040 [Terriglobia bacterium]
MSKEINPGIEPQSKRPLSPQQVKQRRAAAKKSTGPRTLAGKSRASKNNIIHGHSPRKTQSHLMALYDSMVEIGEDPEEFSKLHEGIVESFHPSNPGQAVLAREIAWLHWERQRLERAQAAVLARRVQELEIKRQRKSLEISQRISAQLPAVMQNIGFIWAEESPEKFQKLLELLDQLNECVAAQVYAGVGVIIDWIYGPSPTTRGALVKLLFGQLAEASGVDLAVDPDDGPPLLAKGADSDQEQEEKDEGGDSRVTVSKLRRELEAEIASITQQYWLYRRQYVDVTPTMRAECLVPTIEHRWLMRQLNITDRNIDRKVRLMMDQKRMERKEEIGANED